MMSDKFIWNDGDVEIVKEGDGPPLTLYGSNGEPLASDFRESDLFLVLAWAIRALGENDSDAGSAIQRTMEWLAAEYRVDVRAVIEAVAVVNRGHVEEP